MKEGEIQVDAALRWEKEPWIEHRKTIHSFLVPIPKKVYDFSSVTLNALGTIDSKRDLAGVNFSGLCFFDCELKNGYFIAANFENCIFSNVKLTNINFDSCNFKNAEFYNVELIKGSTISEANFEDALIDGLKNLSDESMKKPIKYSRLRYRTVVLKTAIKIAPWIKHITFNRIFKGKKDYEGKKHTTFTNIVTDNLNSSANKEIREHINWYQHLMNQIDAYHERKKRYKLSLVLAIISTNYWSAYRSLAFLAIALNALVATILSLWPQTFLFKIPEDSNAVPLINWNWAAKFYYSIVTFTTLGYGDVTPLTLPAQFIAGTVAVSGYIILGTMIYLMSRKADNKF